MIDEKVWSDMRARLMGLKVADLKSIAREEHIALGYSASRKDDTVACIVAARRHRTLEAKEDPATHPWRRWRSVKGCN